MALLLPSCTLNRLQLVFYYPPVLFQFVWLGLLDRFRNMETDALFPERVSLLFFSGAFPPFPPRFTLTPPLI